MPFRRAAGRPSKNGHRPIGAYDGHMATKKKAVGVVTEGAAQAVLRRGTARDLTPEEERVMRMRLGASPPRAAALARTVEGMSDLEIEVYAAEIEAYMKWKARGVEAEPAVRPAAPALPSRTKEKIVRALRRKA
jgi:MoxR-like ATPase